MFIMLTSALEKWSKSSDSIINFILKDKPVKILNALYKP